jgi:tetratricopeptide (TPR) repeat protein/tRNA A-37 threonylcarbamoyl transferase component Bud32
MPDVLQRLQEALVDRYAVEREIDRGGMAMVFLAEDVRHHRKVAIKVLHPELTTAVGGERFLFEIEIVAGLQHPHILPLHDSGEAEGLLYYVMPFVEGESLRERLEREGPIPVQEAVRIAAEVADGLDYAHRQGVIHRDVKPGNIMLSQKHAVIMDFGIARALTEARDERLTGTGLTLGTPRYASPEQAMGTDTLDGRSDIYSLGCVLYEMLSGEVPLAASTPQAMQQRRIAETPSPLHGVRATIPPVLDHVIAKALAPIPADRFETADQFARALNVVVGATDEDLVAALALTPAGPSTGAGARSRGSGRSLARIGMGVLVLVLVTLAVGWGVRQATAPTEALDPSHIDAVAAMESYDKALHWVGKRTQAGSDTAIFYFRRATLADPTMAIAWSGLAEALIIAMYWQHVPEDDSLRAEARGAALRGLELDSARAETRTTWANILLEIDADTVAAETEFRRAIGINPDDANARKSYGEFLLGIGREQEGLEQMQRAFELDPSSPVVNQILANQYLFSEFRFEDAVRHYGYVQDLEPSFFMASGWKAVALACLGREDEARTEAERVLQRPEESNYASVQAARVLYMIRDYDAALSSLQTIREHGTGYAPAWSVFAQLERGDAEGALTEYRTFADGRVDQPYPPLLLAYIYARTGDAARARALVDATEVEEGGSIEIAGFSALVYTALGETDLAMDLLVRKYEAGDDASTLIGLAVDPVFDPLRDEPRFQALLERMNLGDVPRPDL